MGMGDKMPREELSGVVGSTETPVHAPTSFLEVRDLKIHFPTDDGLVRSVDGLSFQLERGRTLGIVGESGSGKSVTSLGILGLHNKRNSRVSGEIWLDGRELVEAGPEEVRRLRGKDMSMIFQDPLSSMHPFYTVGDQIIEAYRIHNDVSKSVARKHAIDMLGRVGIPTPDKRVDDYPHQFSGGMRQRAMIAMALSCDPELLIADEPTTALDVTVQAQILDLLRGLQQEFNSAIIMITHDLGVVAELADDILVMYGGRCVEYATVEDAFHNPLHPYTWGLLGSMPRMDRERTERLLPIKGTPPSLINLPSGCAFHPRCAFEELTEGRGRTEVPELREVEPGHRAACHLSLERRREIWNDEIRPKL
jgi:peptide/nickel transport system ATP-binding protein